MKKKTHQIIFDAKCVSKKKLDHVGKKISIFSCKNIEKLLCVCLSAKKKYCFFLVCFKEIGMRSFNSHELNHQASFSNNIITEPIHTETSLITRWRRLSFWLCTKKITFKFHKNGNFIRKINKFNHKPSHTSIREPLLTNTHGTKYHNQLA
jgi:hypothetical protein